MRGNEGNEGSLGNGGDDGAGEEREEKRYAEASMRPSPRERRIELIRWIIDMNTGIFCRYSVNTMRAVRSVKGKDSR